MPSYPKEGNAETAGPASGHMVELDLQLTHIDMASCLLTNPTPSTLPSALPHLCLRQDGPLPLPAVKIDPSFKAKVKPPLT